MSENNLVDPIVIDLNSEYKIKIEKGKDFETSIFKEVYQSAKISVEEIIAHWEESKKEQDSERCKSITRPDAYNNIIAFTGERGKGKSSVMISFLDSLVDMNCDDQKSYYDPSFVSGKNFIGLDVIDPSLFRGDETLFEIILAKMFSRFSKILNDDRYSKTNITEEERRELVRLFQKVFENLKYINGNRQELYKQDALDALIKLSTSSNLVDSFRDLVQKFVKTLGNEKKENYLVIAIDDFDLNIEGVYTMLEDVRQFLISENVLILIACKMEQMKEAVQAHIYSDYIKKMGFKPELLDRVFDEEEIVNKSERYVDKIIPNKRGNELSYNGSNILVRINQEEYRIESYNEVLNKILWENFKVLNRNIFDKNILYPSTLRELISLAPYLKDINKIELELKKNLKAKVKILNTKNEDINIDLNYLDNLENKSLNRSIYFYSELIKVVFERLKINSASSYFIIDPNNSSLEGSANKVSFINLLSNLIRYYPSYLKQDFLGVVQYILLCCNLEFNRLINKNSNNDTAILIAPKSGFNSYVTKYRIINSRIVKGEIFERDFFSINVDRYGLKRLVDQLDDVMEKSVFILLINIVGANEKLTSSSFGSFTEFNQYTSYEFSIFNLFNHFSLRTLPDEIIRSSKHFNFKKKMILWNNSPELKLFKNPIFFSDFSVLLRKKLEKGQYFSSSSSVVPTIEIDGTMREDYFKHLLIIIQKVIPDVLEDLDETYFNANLELRDLYIKNPLLRYLHELDADNNSPLKDLVNRCFHKMIKEDTEIISFIEQPKIVTRDKELNLFLDQLDRNIRKGTPKKKILTLIQSFSDSKIKNDLLEVYLRERDGSIGWIKQSLRVFINENFN